MQGHTEEEKAGGSLRVIVSILCILSLYRFGSSPLSLKLDSRLLLAVAFSLASSAAAATSATSASLRRLLFRAVRFSLQSVQT